MTLLIRTEMIDDIHATDSLIHEAFGSNEEVHLVQLLRERSELIVSLVAVSNNLIVGHVATSPVTLNEHSCSIVGIAPLAVLPSHQKQGIGTALMNRILENIKDIGFKVAVLLGDPKYYSRFGFQPASTFNLDNEYNAKDAFMAMALQPNALEDTKGLVRYSPTFEECGS